MRSVNSSTLHIGAVQIPIKVYKAHNQFEFSGHYHHENCGERIEAPFRCPVHDDDTQPLFYSGIQIGGKIVKIPSAIRDELLERKHPITVAGTMKMTEIPGFLMDTLIIGNYFVEPQGLEDIRTPHANALQSLLDKLAQRKRVLVVSLGVGGLKRYGLLFPNGRLATLSYTEELVEGHSWIGYPTSELNGHMLRFIDNAKTGFVKFSLRAIARRVDAWQMSHVPGPRKNAKKSAKEKVNA